MDFSKRVDWFEPKLEYTRCIFKCGDRCSKLNPIPCVKLGEYGDYIIAACLGVKASSPISAGLMGIPKDYDFVRRKGRQSFWDINNLVGDPLFQDEALKEVCLSTYWPILKTILATR